jgi:hypothetical protein
VPILHLTGIFLPRPVLLEDPLDAISQLAEPPLGVL